MPLYVKFSMKLLVLVVLIPLLRNLIRNGQNTLAIANLTTLLLRNQRGVSFPKGKYTSVGDPETPVPDNHIALSVKSLATGHLSVLCGPRPRPRSRSWISFLLDMIQLNGIWSLTVQKVSTCHFLKVLMNKVKY
jgi:hypothetical protein